MIVYIEARIIYRRRLRAFVWIICGGLTEKVTHRGCCWFANPRAPPIPKWKPAPRSLWFLGHTYSIIPARAPAMMLLGICMLEGCLEG